VISTDDGVCECEKVELDGKTVIGAGVILFIVVVGLWYVFLK